VHTWSEYLLKSVLISPAMTQAVLVCLILHKVFSSKSVNKLILLLGCLKIPPTIYLDWRLPTDFVISSQTFSIATSSWSAIVYIHY